MATYTFSAETDQTQLVSPSQGGRLETGCGPTCRTAPSVWETPLGLTDPRSRGLTGKEPLKVLDTKDPRRRIKIA